MAAHRFERQHHLTDPTSTLGDYLKDTSNYELLDGNGGSELNRRDRPMGTASPHSLHDAIRPVRSKTLGRTFAVRRRPTAPGYVKDPMRIAFTPTLTTDDDGEEILDQKAMIGRIASDVVWSTQQVEASIGEGHKIALGRTVSGSYREVLLDGLDDPVAFIERQVILFKMNAGF
jgi:hypothetical protein